LRPLGFCDPPRPRGGGGHVLPVKINPPKKKIVGEEGIYFLEKRGLPFFRLTTED
jgi:hypothetical protein